jgi:hypothetical protein
LDFFPRKVSIVRPGIAGYSIQAWRTQWLVQPPCAPPRLLHRAKLYSLSKPALLPSRLPKSNA